MARPRTPIGTYGTISIRRQRSGRYAARTRYRDWDGKSREVQSTGTTRPAAERALKKKLAERSLFHPGFTGMSADSAFTALVEYWLDDMELEDRLSCTTRQLYERNMRTLVLPFFQDVTLREIGVARCDYFLKQLAKQSYNRARQARVVLRLALDLAVRHEILPRNPMDHVSRLRRPTRSPDVFTWDEITAIRSAIRDWEKRPILAGPRPDGQLGQIVEVMLGTSARIGEVLAIRVADLDLDAPVPMVRIAGTIVSRKGEPTHRQDHPKTARSVRRVALSRVRVACRPCPSPQPALRRPGDAVVRHSCRNTAHNEQRPPPAPRHHGPSRHPRRHTASVPPHRRHSDQRRRRTPARLRAPRPQRPRDHPRALHPPQRNR